MHRLVLAAAFLGGCAAPADPVPDPNPRADCRCERKICVCPHCKGGAPKCPCREIEKPK